MKEAIYLYNHLRENKMFSSVVVPMYRNLKKLSRIPSQKRKYSMLHSVLTTREKGNKRIYYLGSPLHANLGDLAQGVCTRRWLGQYFGEYEIIEIKTNCIVNTRFSILETLKECYQNGDLIIFQSGYATTDLGGYADDMHCAVMQALPKAKMLMLPQTVFFESEERKQRTSQIYNSTENMLFLARDRVSYEMAKEMFPDRRVLLYPDIVTTLIGSKTYTAKREGILFCCRDDSEKFYSDKEFKTLIDKCATIAPVNRTDTTKYSNEKEIICNPEAFIWKEIEMYSRYKAVITDRYHGTIFSLIAGTPVIIVKSTDHKVVTGADWFKGVYDDYVYVANSLEDAYEIVQRIYPKELSHKLEPYFEEHYYNRLPDVFRESIIAG